MYLTERKDRLRHKCVTDPAFDSLNNTYERALVFMHKMPRIWLEYTKFLQLQRKVTKTRHAYDRALRSLPITQHDKIWKQYIAFAKQSNVPEMAYRIFRRFMKLDPDSVEEYVNYLAKHEQWNEAATLLAQALNRESFISKQGKSKHQLWLELCDMCTKHAQNITTLKVEPIVRGALKRFTDDVGRLWTSLADYFIRLGHFEKARDIFEEGINTVITVRDFSMIFDAYTQFEETMISAKMQDDESENQQAEDDLDVEGDDLELRLARLQYLLDRRAELLCSVRLRQNPHNVHEWHRRVKIFEEQDNPEKVIKAYAEAVQTVDPIKADGKPHTLWVSFAKYYEDNDDLDSARDILERASKVEFRSVEDLATVWCEWAEMELRHDEFEKAIKVLHKATYVSDRVARASVGKENPNLSVQQRLWKSTKLWSMYADLEESLGTLESTKAVYERMIDLKVVTPQILINYAHMLEEAKYFEESFKVYEKGVNAFEWPLSKELWVAYLSKFVKRYEGKKMERARDLFEQALSKIPERERRAIFLMYAKFEEDFGLVKNTMSVYERACKEIAPEERYDLYIQYINKASEYFGITKTRPIYEDAMQHVPDSRIKDVAVKYSELEQTLGEIDRARAIYQYGSQHCDPGKDEQLWKLWHAFEVRHGNEDTFRDMLRIKRSVQLQFSQAHVNATDAAMALIEQGPAAKRQRVSNDMEALERQMMQETMQSMADAPSESTGGDIVAMSSDGPVNNNDEIALDDDEEDDEEATKMALENADDGKGLKSLAIAEKAIPSAVYGGFVKEGEAPQGALARFRNQSK
uniref:Suppressor of forked domain-containing protein n=1 Tax=Guillardia theta TaxID=55529 RepID=A0A7S4KX00_GUITH